MVLNDGFKHTGVPLTRLVGCRSEEEGSGSGLASDVSCGLTCVVMVWL